MRHLRAAALVFILALVAVLFPFELGVSTASAQTSTASSSLEANITSDNSQITVLDQQIAQYQAQLQQIGANKRTLQQAIKLLDLRKEKIVAQEAVTQNEINITKLQVQQLGGEIMDAQTQIGSDQAAIAATLLNIEKADGRSLFMQVIAAGDVNEAWNDVNANLQVGAAVKNAMDALRTQQANLADAKTTSEAKQSTLASQQQALASQQQSLAATVASKSDLLVQTNAKESNYQKLLAQAEQQINSLTTFVQNAGGAKLVGNETICDSWGCYYNQRDSAWGSDPLDGTRYTIASDGCLMTDVAMVMTHYGYRTVTPLTINSDSNNFAAYYPALLMRTIVVDGATVTRTAAYIDSTLATGNPVIVGVRAYGGTHYVVLTSGKKGNYIMRDPYVANGNNITFASHYTMRSIFSIEKVTVKSS